MKTRIDVVTRALRQAGVVGISEAPEANVFQNASDILDGIIAESAFTFTPDTTPDNAFIPLANWLAKEVSPGFGMTDQERARCKLRLFAVLYPDDRPVDLYDTYPVYY